MPPPRQNDKLGTFYRINGKESNICNDLAIANRASLIRNNEPSTIYTSLKCTAFTLAEVLITLGIIGIVAAITIPSLIEKQKEKVTITKLKKINSIFFSAYTLAINEHGTPNTWDDFKNADRTEYSMIFWSKLRPYLNITKECTPAKRFECWQPNAYFKFIDGTSTQMHVHNGNQMTAILNDGTMLALSAAPVTYGGECEKNYQYASCASIVVKTDGAKDMLYGKNIFEFRFDHSIFYPSGKNKPLTECLNNGMKCAAWVVYNENMDYIRCKDLSWNGKTKCD